MHCVSLKAYGTAPQHGTCHPNVKGRHLNARRPGPPNGAEIPLTIGYNSLEAVESLLAGILSGSVALVGFGIDSVIEVTSSMAAQWRVRSDVDSSRRERVEVITLRIVGWCFIALAIYITLDSAKSLFGREVPSRSIFGLVVLLLSVIVMPLLARAKRRVALEMGSGALEADAKQTALCACLSLIALVGVGLNAMLGWWWA